MTMDPITPYFETQRNECVPDTATAKIPEMAGQRSAVEWTVKRMPIDDAKQRREVMK
jgi:hypothetical protein